jgi:hypothetical protein
VTAGFLPDPSASTTSAGTGRPVAVLPPSSTCVRNFMAASMPRAGLPGGEAGTGRQTPAVVRIQLRLDAMLA